MDRRLPELDLGHLLAGLASGSATTREADLLAAGGGRLDGPHRCVIPWSALQQRDLTAAGSPALVEVETQSAAAALRPASVAIASGAVVLEQLTGSQALPKTTGKVTTQWLTSEGDPIIESQPTIGQITLNPKTVGAFLQHSRQIGLQGVAFSQFIRNELVAAAAQAVDVGVLAGAGSAGAPLGVLSVPTIGTTSGSGVAYSALLTAVQTLLAAGASEAGMAWVVDPATATILRGRVRITGADRAILDDDNRIAGYPARVSSNCPASTILLCDWSKVVIGFFGPGISVSVDPFTSFQQGIIGARVLASVDCGLLYPAAAYSITSVS